MARQIVLVRHGETEWSASGRHTSHTDLPLTEDGRQAATKLRGPLQAHGFELVLTSPLRRAQETCELAGFGARAELDAAAQEWEYGDYEGMTTPEILEQRPDWNLWRDGCPEGESPEDIGRRADSLLARFAEVEGEALIFAHGHILRVLTARWLGFGPEAGARFKLEAGAISILGYERDTEALVSWNLGVED